MKKSVTQNMTASLTKATMRTSLFLGACTLSVSLIGCSDFFNSPKNTVTNERSAGEVQGPKRPDVNPLPPGFEDPNAGKFSEEKMMVNIGLNVIASAAQDVALETSVLEKRLVKACGQAQQAEDLDMADWEEARMQWKRAMLAYHRADTFPVGPLWADDKKLSSRIYAWPLFNPCGIDAETVKTKEGIGTAVTDLPTPVRGLGAMEYLLFEEGMKTRCNARAYPQVIKWTSLSVEEKRLDRCRVALKLSSDVRALAQEFADEWNPAGRNYTRRFIDKSDASMPTVMSATNALTDSLFQIESLKDQRLARPLGLMKECASETGICPQDAEHQYAGFALESATARLAAFHDVYLGRFSDSASGKSVNGFGFDDFLVARGHGEIATRLGEAIDKARRGFSAVRTTNLVEAIGSMSKDECVASTSTDRKVEICALYQDVRVITTSLKTEFLAVLALRAPPTYQGDND